VGHPPHGWIHPANVTPEARDGVVLRVRIEVGQTISIPAVSAELLWTANNWLAHRNDGEPHRVSVRRLSAVDEVLRRERTPLVAGALGEGVNLVRGPETAAR